MIAPRPAERFRSYDELVAELERALKKLADEKKVDAPAVKRKLRWIAAIAAPVLVVVAIAVFVFVRNSQRTIASDKIRAASSMPAKQSATLRTEPAAAAQAPDARILF